MGEATWALAGVLVGALLTAFARRILRVRRSATPAPSDAVDPTAATTGLTDVSPATILSSLPDGVILFGPNGAAAFVSEAAAGLVGTIPSDRSKLVPLGVREAAERASAGVVADIVVETGSPARWLRAIATPAATDGGVLLVLRDVTESRRLDAVRRDFVTNASHELKTPAASIQALAETLRGAIRDDPEVAPRFADQLQAEAARLSRIVTELLDLSRLEAGGETPQPVDLIPLVREEVERCTERARDADVELEVEASAPVSVAGSRQDLALLVRNLLDNALRASPATAVRVATSTDGTHVELSVADDGVGIPTKDLPRIFERFYRVDRARSRESGGTGLGLAIVKHVAENHGGSVSVRSELGRGSEFTVRLPQA